MNKPHLKYVIFKILELDLIKIIKTLNYIKNCNEYNDELALHHIFMNNYII